MSRSTRQITLITTRVKRVMELSSLTNIRLATLCVPGYHCLWPTFPGCSARLANLWTLCKTLVDLASNPDLSLKVKYRDWLFVMSQPLLDIRLPTYPSVTRRKPKKFGLFRIRSPLLTESLFTFSSSPY